MHNTRYVGNQTFKSDWFESIPAEKLSTGVKCAILLMKYQKEDREFYPDLIDMGENLYPFIMEYAKDNELYVGTSLDDLYLSSEDFTFRYTNDNKVYHTLDDLYELNYEYYIKYELEELEEYEREEEEYYRELENMRNDIRVAITGEGKDIFDITLDRKINIILDYSSSGKSYLCDVIRKLGGV